MRSSLLILTVFLAAGCSRNIDVDDTNDGDDTSETQDTSDTEDTEDTEDTGNPDTGDPNAVDCNADYQTPAIDGEGADACHTEELSCGDTVYGSTEGGSTHYDRTHYMQFFCIDTRDDGVDFEGPERVYPLDVPAQTSVKVTLETPCGDLALRYVRTGEDDCLPSNYVNIRDCDPDYRTGDHQEMTFNTTVNPLHYEIVVDTREDPGNFKLTVECD